MSKVRGAGRAYPKGYSRKRTFICYLSCWICDHWRPLSKVQLRALMTPVRFFCPFCADGRKAVCATWDGKTRAMPVPPMLDVRLPEQPALLNDG
jgi:hypothetical protein